MNWTIQVHHLIPGFLQALLCLATLSLTCIQCVLWPKEAEMIKGTVMMIAICEFLCFFLKLQRLMPPREIVNSLDRYLTFHFTGMSLAIYTVRYSISMARQLQYSKSTLISIMSYTIGLYVVSMLAGLLCPICFRRKLCSFMHEIKWFPLFVILAYFFYLLILMSGLPLNHL